MEFLAISYHLPANPSRYRVATWKKLKILGAVYLQPGVAVLPLSEDNLEAFQNIGDDVRTWNGNASILTIQFTDPKDETAMLNGFSSARTEEYQAITADCGRLLAQLQWERENGKFDEPRYILEQGRLYRRMERAIQHDFFGAEGREEAAALLVQLDKELPVRVEKKVEAAKARVKAPAKMEPVSQAKSGPAEPQMEHAAEKEKSEQDDRREMPVFLF